MCESECVYIIKNGLFNIEILNWVHINRRNANDGKFGIDVAPMLIAFYAVGVERAIARETRG